MNDATVALRPETVLAEMRKNGVTDVVWLPDSETNWLFLLMQAEPGLRLVGVSREGHACSIASGLHTGGRRPMILIQNTGLMESGDSIRGWLLGMNVPVVMMVGYRGWTRHGVNADSAATYTERFLHAFDLPFYLVESDADAGRISIAFAEAERRRGPAVVLVGRVSRVQPVKGSCLSLRAAGEAIPIQLCAWLGIASPAARNDSVSGTQ
jgi:sulfopyruvate decarboxylase TPP-binding subunit